VQSYAAQTAARGAAILTVDALNMMLMALLVFLVLRQVMPIAAGLAGGASLNSFGIVGGGFSWAARTTTARMARVARPARAVATRYAGRIVATAARDPGAGIEALARNWRGRDR
jgi:hypothetical protein